MAAVDCAGCSADTSKSFNFLLSEYDECNASKVATTNRSNSIQRIQKRIQRTSRFHTILVYWPTVSVHRELCNAAFRQKSLMNCIPPKIRYCLQNT